MAKSIDLSLLSITEANELIRQCGMAGEDVEIINPDARHNIGVGLTHPINVRVKGSGGYFCAGLTDQAVFHIDQNVGWAVGDNMYSGTVYVGGNAGAIAGCAIRGADVVVRGNMGSRAGQVMKAGNLIAGGDASFMTGYMMYGGRIIVCGDAGEKLGQDMSGGEIFVGGKCGDLGADAMLADVGAAEIDEIMALLDKHRIPFKGSFRKIINAGKKLRYGTPEPRDRPQPFFHNSGRSDYWNSKVRHDIHVKALTGRYRIRGYGSAKPMPHFSDLAFRKDLSHAGRDPEALKRVSMKTSLGGRYGAKPIELSMPVQLAPMSFGALSRSTKMSLAIASRLSGISENTGEGGMMDRQRAEASQLIYQCLAGRLGWNVKDMQRADALEIYISQGAKPGLGGQLMAKKVTKELAEIRGIPAGIDLRSPSRHPDVLGADDLVIKLSELREAVGHRLPVSIKMGGGRVRDDIKIAYKDGFDYVSLDGMQGGTGAASVEVLENVGIPTLAVLQEALDGLADIEAGPDMQIVIMGGIKDGVDAAKALALGADAVAVGTAALIAGGCIACQQCNVGTCPVGICTQDPEHERRYAVDREALNIHHFLEGMRWQIAAITDALGYDDVKKLSRDDLVALTPEAAALTGLPYEPQQRDLQNAPLRKAG
jgi:glutamate synthase domain-containing protein 2/formylmethanofuran dehydrogenase subunit C